MLSLLVVALMLVGCARISKAPLAVEKDHLVFPLYSTVQLSKFLENLTEENRNRNDLEIAFSLGEETMNLEELQKKISKQYQIELEDQEVPIVEEMAFVVCEQNGKDSSCLSVPIKGKKEKEDQIEYFYNGKKLEKNADGKYVVEWAGGSNSIQVHKSEYQFGRYHRIDMEEIEIRQNQKEYQFQNDMIEIKQKKDNHTVKENNAVKENHTVKDKRPIKETNNHENTKEKEFVIIDDDKAHRIDVVVNRKNRLSSHFEPDWMYIDAKYAVDSGYRVQKEAAKAFMDLADTAEKEMGKRVYVTSSYRSYESQKRLYDNYVDKHGLEEANRFSAPPGASEHQTGLAIDVVGENRDMWGFGKTDEAKWLHANAHRFGFILRYPEGKESITGYMPEAWHIRYVGKSIAKEIYEKGITLEEYFQS